MKTELLKTEGGYDFYRLTDTEGRSYWNIMPHGAAAPEGGYKSQAYVEHIKHAKF